MTALLLMGEVTIWDFVIILAVVVALFVGAEYLNRHDTHPTGTTFMVDKGGRYEFHVVATYPTTAPAPAAAPPAATANDPARLARLDSLHVVRGGAAATTDHYQFIDAAQMLIAIQTGTYPDGTVWS